MRAARPTVAVDILDCVTSSHSQPDRVEIVVGDCGRGGQRAAPPMVSSEMPGYLRASALAASIAFSVKPPRLATCS